MDVERQYYVKVFDYDGNWFCSVLVDGPEEASDVYDVTLAMGGEADIDYYLK